MSERTEAEGPPVLELVQVARSFTQGSTTLRIIDAADLAVQPGEMVGLVGPSGAGKSSLLHIAGLLETPDRGEVLIAGVACSGLDDARRTAIRRREIGFVYQAHHLLPEFTALENVALPQMIAGIARADALAEASGLLARLGLAERLRHRPAELSGGEQQRVAIARALANAPRLLLADEPTGNLDPATADHVYAELLGLVRERRLSALIATHNTDLARDMDRVVRLDQGRLVEEQPAPA